MEGSLSTCDIGYNCFDYPRSGLLFQPPEGAGVTIGAEAEDRAQFMLLMRAKGVRDLALLRALERAPRALFAPHISASKKKNFALEVVQLFDHNGLPWRG